PKNAEVTFINNYLTSEMQSPAHDVVSKQVVESIVAVGGNHDPRFNDIFQGSMISSNIQ
ncbi:hypothetical protein C6P40_004848, partial [Pichia californica]